MRIGDKVWYCLKLETPDSNGEEYSEAIGVVTRPMHFTVMSKNGYTDIMELGERVKDYLTVIAQPYNAWKNVFHEGDLFYCNGAKPNESENWHGEQANYVVDNVDYGNISIKLTLKKVASK